MQKLFPLIFLLVLAGTATGQVDTEHRRVLLLQSGFAVGPSQEKLGGFGFFWFNENHCPWTNTVLRLIFAGIHGDAVLSWFVLPSTNTALGVGLGGGAYLNSIYPYADGRRLYAQEFDGDIVNARVFINQTIPNPTPLPLNLRLTYAPSFQWFHATDNTRDFQRPRDFFTHTVLGELRLGGIEPGLTKHRGLEVYLLAEASYRSGFDPFGPTAAPYPTDSNYQRVFGSLSGKFPVGPVLLSARVGVGDIHHCDVLNAWKLGGNGVGTDDYSMALHGYYTRELFAESVFIANLDIGIPLLDNHRLILHLYADNAYAKTLDARTGVAEDWHNYLGLGVGLGLRTFWGAHLLLSYGYGVNAVRYDHHGGHEIGITLEKSF